MQVGKPSAVVCALSVIPTVDNLDFLLTWDRCPDSIDPRETRDMATRNGIILDWTEGLVDVEAVMDTLASQDFDPLLYMAAAEYRVMSALRSLSGDDRSFVELLEGIDSGRIR